MIPRAITAVFQRLREVREWDVKVSFMELYNEELTDLMADDSTKLRLFEDQAGTGGVLVHGLEEKHCGNAVEVFEIVKNCFERRKRAATNMNEQSRYTTMAVIVC